MTTFDQPAATQESFLVADCGTTNTMVALFDVAAGNYRLIARANAFTTTQSPHHDIAKGLIEAIQQISKVTGRDLLSERGTLMRPTRPNGSGVDHFAAVVSAAPALSTFIVGLFDDVSIASARKALSAVYANEVDSLSPNDGRNEQAQIAAIVEKRPDLLFLVGGTDGGAEQRLRDLVETISLGVSLLAQAGQPQVLYAGNNRLREWVRHSLGESASVQVAKNVRPSLDNEQLNDAANSVSNLYQKLKLEKIPGIQRVKEWTSYPLAPTAKAFTTITQYFATLQKSRVLGVDLGSSSITLILAEAVDARVAVRTDLGMGRPLVNLLSRLDVSKVVDWLPFPVEVSDVRDFIQQKSLHPQTIPVTEPELYLEQAVAREILRSAAVEAFTEWTGSPNGLPPFSLLLARGGVLSNAPRPGQTLLMLLDALQPAGLFSVATDPHGILPAMGTLAAHDPLAVVQALEGGVISPLGWVIVPTGKGKPGQKVIRVIMESKQTKRLEIEVEYGAIEVVPLAAGQSAEVILQPARRFDIGFGPGQGKKVTLHGGSLGLLVDARGRPLTVPDDGLARNELVRQWLWDVGG